MPEHNAYTLYCWCSTYSNRFRWICLHIAAEVAFDLLRFAMIWDDYWLVNLWHPTEEPCQGEWLCHPRGELRQQLIHQCLHWGSLIDIPCVIYIATCLWFWYVLVLFCRRHARWMLPSWSSFQLVDLNFMPGRAWTLSCKWLWVPGSFVRILFEPSASAK